MYQRTGSSLAIASTVFFEVVLVVLLAPVAGVMIDRLPRKPVLVVSDVGRAVLVLALLTTEQWQVYAIVFLLTAAGTFFNPAVSAMLPTLLSADDLLAANSISGSTGRFVQITGATVALGVIETASAEAAFVFNACTFLVSALLLLLPVPPRQQIEALAAWDCFDGGHDLAAQVRALCIPDFSAWKDHDGFAAAFAKLLRELRADTPPVRAAV